MVWDKDNPPGSTKVRNADDLIRGNNAALESALSEGHEFSTGGNQTGKHTTPTFKDNGGDPSQPTATNESALYNSGGRLYTLNQAGTKRNVDQYTDIPQGTKCLFYQSAAPTGWTQDTSVNDAVIRIVSGSGGGTGGTNGIANISTEGHTLTLAESPSHNHGGGYHDHNLATEDGSGAYSSQLSQGTGHSEKTTSAPVYGSGTIISSNGGDGSHSHNIDPKYADFIIATKD